MKDFNWQILSESADAPPVVLELKGGHTVWDGRDKPVWVTSSHAPEDVMAGQAPARSKAQKRRFQIIELRWRRLSRAKLLDCRIKPKEAFRAPKKCWGTTGEHGEEEGQTEEC
jgi:hypothetical protein